MQGNHKLLKKYVKLMREYISLGHMEDDTEQDQVQKQEVFLSHYTITASLKLTTKQQNSE